MSTAPRLARLAGKVFYRLACEGEVPPSGPVLAQPAAASAASTMNAFLCMTLSTSTRAPSCAERGARPWAGSAARSQTSESERRTVQPLRRNAGERSGLRSRDPVSGLLGQEKRWKRGDRGRRGAARSARRAVRIVGRLAARAVVVMMARGGRAMLVIVVSLRPAIVVSKGHAKPGADGRDPLRGNNERKGEDDQQAGKGSRHRSEVYSSGSTPFRRDSSRPRVKLTPLRLRARAFRGPGRRASPLPACRRAA